MDRLARSLADTGLPHPLLVDAARLAIAAGDPDGARAEAEQLARSLLQPVINATGVLLHTNLGRAPIAVDHPAVYRNLELDLDHREPGLTPGPRRRPASPGPAEPKRPWW